MAIEIRNSMVIFFKFKLYRNIQRDGKTKRIAQLP
jgi:hypothetical protein